MNIYHKKALEIVIKMQFQTSELIFDSAKKCALICVDEIIDECICHYETINEHYDKIRYDYWLKVKKELEAL